MMSSSVDGWGGRDRGPAAPRPSVRVLGGVFGREVAGEVGLHPFKAVGLGLVDLEQAGGQRRPALLDRAEDMVAGNAVEAHRGDRVIGLGQAGMAEVAALDR